MESARQASMMTALYETTRNLVEERNVSRLLTTIVERATWLVGAQGGGLYLCEPEQRQVRCVVSYNTPRDFTGTVLMYGEGAAGRVAMIGTPLIIDDYHAWEGRARAYEREQPFHKVLSVPMIWQDAVIGVLHMLGYDRERQFTQDDQQLAMLFANQAAIAVQNARLIEQVQGHAADLEQRVAERTQKLQERSAELESIHRITEKLLSTEDIAAIQVTVIESIEKLLDLSLATIALFAEEESVFTSAAVYPPLTANVAKLMGIVDIARYKFPYKLGANPVMDGAVQTQQSFVTHSFAEIAAPYLPRIIAEATQRYYKTRTYMSLPLVIENKTIGFILIGTRREHIHPEERAALELIAGQTAVALSRARHYALAQERAAELARTMSQMAHEIDERRQAEARLMASLKEKEVLLREVYHRVKNNLQVISSILNLQAGYYDGEPRVIATLRETQTRVRSMALVHEKLYQTDDLAQIDFGDYVRSLVAMLFRAYDLTTESVQQAISITNIALGLDTAVPCGLIINELVSNALKYAFPDLRRTQRGPRARAVGMISITMEALSADRYRLIIADNGIGMSPDFDIQLAKTLGLQLVVLLVEQLSGTIHIDRQRGTTFRIVFSPIVYASRGSA